MTARIVAVMAATSLLVPIACGDTTEDLADELVDRAKAAVTARDYEMATHYARTALEEDPTSREAEIIVTYADHGDQMLHGAFWENDQAAIELLADIVADIDVVDDRFGAPVLVLAAAWGHSDVVDILLEAGADPNAGAGTDGLTALMWAAKNFDEQEAMTRALLEAGADVNARSLRGETALQIAREYQNPNVAALLEEYGATD